MVALIVGTSESRRAQFMVRMAAALIVGVGEVRAKVGIGVFGVGCCLRLLRHSHFNYN